jgi:RAB protein geranylgeranyltransferase component A
VRFQRISKLLEKGRVLANKRYSELDDGNVYGSVNESELTRRIDRLINRKRKIMEGSYGISIRKKSSERHVFFDFSKELRPKVLHSKSNHSHLKHKKTVT